MNLAGRKIFLGLLAEEKMPMCLIILNDHFKTITVNVCVSVGIDSNYCFQSGCHFCSAASLKRGRVVTDANL